MVHTKFMEFLVLTPTPLELQALPLLREKLADCIQVCGFGPIASAAKSMQLIQRLKPKRVILTGIAGSYDRHRAEIGSAFEFTSLSLDGVGARQSPGHILTPYEMELAIWPGPPPVYQQLTCNPDAPPTPSWDLTAVELITVCEASGSDTDREQRLSIYPNALAEDMESFAVAMTCHLAQVPLTIVRGISNLCGDRNLQNWQIEPALTQAQNIVMSSITGNAKHD